MKLFGRGSPHEAGTKTPVSALRGSCCCHGHLTSATTAPHKDTWRRFIPSTGWPVCCLVVLLHALCCLAPCCPLAAGYGNRHGWPPNVGPPRLLAVLAPKVGGQSLSRNPSATGPHCQCACSVADSIQSLDSSQSVDFWLLTPWTSGYSLRGLLATQTVDCWLLTPWTAGYSHRGLLATHTVDCWLFTSWIAGSLRYG